MIEGKILVSKGKTWATKGKNCVIEGKSSHASSSDKKHTDWAKPNQLPAGPREKRPIGRLFSSTIYYNTLPPDTAQERLKSVPSL